MDTEIDIEDIGKEPSERTEIRPVVHTVKRKRQDSPPPAATNWRDALGAPPPFGNTKVLQIVID